MLFGHGSKFASLVVDDSLSLRMLITSMLRDLGYKDVTHADSGEAALRILDKQKVDLIVSDLDMPMGDGLSLLKAVRGNANTKNLPFLLVTARGDRVTVLQAFEAGVSDFIVKPFTSETFQSKIEKILK